MALYLSRSEMAEIEKKVEFYLSVRRFDAAEKLLRSTLATNGAVANIYNLLGLTYHKQSRFADAVREFTQAVKANPSYIEASLNLAATLCDLSHYDEAQQVFADINNQINPQKQIPNLVLGRLANQHAQNGKLYEDSGLLTEAIHEYRKALSLFPRMPDVQYSVAQLYLHEEQLEQARLELEELLSTTPEMTTARNLLGIVYYKLGERTQAKQEWSMAAQQSPSDLTSRAYLKIANNWQNL